MRRILIMGPPGSGKSTLARYLGAKLDLPVFHLDQAFHQPGWRPVPPDVFRAAVARMAAGRAWVIDGNYTDTLEPRLSAADTIVYLDVPRWLAMWRVVRRSLLSYGRVRPDAAAGCPERLDWEFLRFAWTWHTTQQARNLALLDRFKGRVIVLHGARQQTRFRDTLEQRTS